MGNDALTEVEAALTPSNAGKLSENSYIEGAHQTHHRHI